MQIIRDVFPNDMPILVDTIKHNGKDLLPDTVNIHPLIEGEDGVVRIGEALPFDMDELKTTREFDKYFKPEDNNNK